MTMESGMTYEAAKRKAKKLGGTYEPTWRNGQWDAEQRNYALVGIGMYGATIGCLGLSVAVDICAESDDKRITATE
jgi:hypothetical protein